MHWSVWFCMFIILQKNTVLLNFILKESWKKSYIFWRITQNIIFNCNISHLLYLYFWSNKCSLGEHTRRLNALFGVVLIYLLRLATKPMTDLLFLLMSWWTSTPITIRDFCSNQKLSFHLITLFCNNPTSILFRRNNALRSLMDAFSLVHALHHIQSITGYLKLMNKYNSSYKYKRLNDIVMFSHQLKTINEFVAAGVKIINSRCEPRNTFWNLTINE